MSLREIVRVLGGDLYDGGRRANVPAPKHSRADRSVSLLLWGYATTFKPLKPD